MGAVEEVRFDSLFYAQESIDAFQLFESLTSVGNGSAFISRAVDEQDRPGSVQGDHVGHLAVLHDARQTIADAVIHREKRVAVGREDAGHHDQLHAFVENRQIERQRATSRKTSQANSLRVNRVLGFKKVNHPHRVPAPQTGR